MDNAKEMAHFRDHFDIVPCIECGRPWGAILRRGVEPAEELREVVQAEMDEWLQDWFELDTEEGTVFDFTKTPRVAPMRIVYLTSALAKFCDDNGICEPTFLDDCWQDIEDVDLPKWLLKGRKQRWAYGWDCCEIGWASNYIKETADA